MEERSIHEDLIIGVVTWMKFIYNWRKIHHHVSILVIITKVKIWQHSMNTSTTTFDGTSDHYIKQETGVDFM